MAASWVRAIGAISPTKTLSNDAFLTLMNECVGPAPAIARRLRWYALAQRPRRLHGAVFDISAKALMKAALHAAEAAAESPAAVPAAEARFEDLVECVSEFRVAQCSVRATLPRVVEVLMACGALLAPRVPPAVPVLLEALREDLAEPSHDGSVDVRLGRVAICTGHWKECLEYAELLKLELRGLAESAGRAIAADDHRNVVMGARLRSTAWEKALEVAAAWLQRAPSVAAGLPAVALVSPLLASGALPPDLRDQKRVAAGVLRAIHDLRGRTRREDLTLADRNALGSFFKGSGLWADGLKFTLATTPAGVPFDDVLVSAAVRALGEARRWAEACEVWAGLQARSARAQSSPAVDYSQSLLAVIYALGRGSRWLEAATVASFGLADSAAAAPHVEHARAVATAAISALGHCDPGTAVGPAEAAFAVLRRLSSSSSSSSQHGTNVDARSVTYMVSLLGAAGRTADAIALLRDRTVMADGERPTMMCVVAILGPLIQRETADALALLALLKECVLERFPPRRAAGYDGRDDLDIRVVTLVCIAGLGCRLGQASNSDFNLHAVEALQALAPYVRSAEDCRIAVRAIARELRNPLLGFRRGMREFPALVQLAVTTVNMGAPHGRWCDPRDLRAVLEAAGVDCTRIAL